MAPRNAAIGLSGPRKGAPPTPICSPPLPQDPPEQNCSSGQSSTSYSSPSPSADGWSAGGIPTLALIKAIVNKNNIVFCPEWPWEFYMCDTAEGLKRLDQEYNGTKNSNSKVMNLTGNECKAIFSKHFDQARPPHTVTFRKHRKALEEHHQIFQEFVQKGRVEEATFRNFVRAYTKNPKYMGPGTVYPLNRLPRPKVPPFALSGATAATLHAPIPCAQTLDAELQPNATPETQLNTNTDRPCLPVSQRNPLPHALEPPQQSRTEVGTPLPDFDFTQYVHVQDLQLSPPPNLDLHTPIDNKTPFDDLNILNDIAAGQDFLDLSDEHFSLLCQNISAPDTSGLPQQLAPVISQEGLDFSFSALQAFGGTLGSTQHTPNEDLAHQAPRNGWDLAHSETPLQPALPNLCNEVPPVYRNNAVPMVGRGQQSASSNAIAPLSQAFDQRTVEFRGAPTMDAASLKRRHDDDGTGFTFGPHRIDMGAAQGQGYQTSRPTKRLRSNRGSDQLSVAPQRGDGVGFPHQQSAEQVASYSHFPPEVSNPIFGASNSAGAANLSRPMDDGRYTQASNQWLNTFSQTQPGFAALSGVTNFSPVQGRFPDSQSRRSTKNGDPGFPGNSSIGW